MTCDQVADAEFLRMLNEQADSLNQAEPSAIITRAQQALGRHAKEFLAKYGEDQFVVGKTLPSTATMEVRGLIALMLTASQDLNLAIGKLGPPNPRR